MGIIKKALKVMEGKLLQGGDLLNESATVKNILGSLDIQVVDHIIVSTLEAVSLAEMKHL